VNPSGYVQIGLNTREKYTSSRPRPSARKCGSRNDISLQLIGYSAGHSRSFQWSCAAGMSGPCGMNLFQPLGLVPPSVPIEPVSASTNHSARATCQPPRFPAAAERQMCAASRWSHWAISPASSSSLAAGTCASWAAKSKVKAA
jgi:hypothetical protein